MAKILFGYDTERFEEPSVTPHFLSKVSQIHREYQVPCTLFLVGKVIEAAADDIKPLVGDPLFDLQQHSYSHKPFKSYVIDFRGVPDEEIQNLEWLRGRPKVVVHRGLSLEEIEEQVTKTQECLRSYLGIEDNRGLTCPFAYYQGLLDRPEITDLLYDLGIRFVRSWGRDSRGWNPTPFDVQPFFYTAHGHDDMLEIPIQGWHDTLWKAQHGWTNVGGYVAMLKGALDEVLEHDYTWSFLAHDWSSIREDPEMSGIRAFIEHALEQDGLDFLSHSDFYEQALAEGQTE
ncbi:MAG: polysaccharide deacetylase family protein [Anaerolineae bacterium]|nr:polysaccharide deacetylase family protein [Anaerolineae bacterium]